MRLQLIVVFVVTLLFCTGSAHSQSKYLEDGEFGLGGSGAFSTGDHGPDAKMVQVGFSFFGRLEVVWIHSWVGSDAVQANGLAAAVYFLKQGSDDSPPVSIGIGGANAVLFDDPDRSFTAGLLVERKQPISRSAFVLPELSVGASFVEGLSAMFQYGLGLSIGLDNLKPLIPVLSGHYSRTRYSFDRGILIFAEGSGSITQWAKQWTISVDIVLSLGHLPDPPQN